jgi:hypothetical protein
MRRIMIIFIGFLAALVGVLLLAANLSRRLGEGGGVPATVVAVEEESVQSLSNRVGEQWLRQEERVEFNLLVLLHDGTEVDVLARQVRVRGTSHRGPQVGDEILIGRREGGQYYMKASSTQPSMLPGVILVAAGGFLLIAEFFGKSVGSRE